MTVAYLDCFSGVSGDMLLGALIDAGAAPAAILRGLRPLRLPAWRWRVARARRGEFTGTRVDVRAADGRARHGVLAAVRARAPRAALPDGVARDAERVFTRLLAAEGAVHGRLARHVHLHELEDLDTLVDVYGVLLALRLLGVTRVFASPVTAGTGTVSAHHGELPVPAPGTAELLRGIPVALGSGTGELATPTGAALVAALAERGTPPVFTLHRIGYGAGARDGGARPNLLRVFVGEAREDAWREDVRQVDAVVDDMSPQLVEAFMERAYREGALEAWTAPVGMKRQRPGIALTALVAPPRLDGVVRAFLEETSTLGVRITSPERVVLARRMTAVRTRWGRVRVKLAGAGAARHAVPEYADVRRLARRSGLPARLVLEEARRACAGLLLDHPKPWRGG